MRLFVVAAICLASLVASDYVDDDNDAIVIEVESSREGKQFNFVADPLSLTYQFRAGHGSCVNSKGSLGKCSKLNHCYPFYQIPNDFPDWVLGTRDICPENRGVCCAHEGHFPGVVATYSVNNNAPTYQNFLYPASTTPLQTRSDMSFGSQGFPSLFQFPGAFPGAFPGGQPQWPQQPQQPAWPQQPQQPAWPQQPQQPAWPQQPPQQPEWPQQPPQQPAVQPPQQPDWPQQTQQPDWPQQTQQPDWPQQTQQPEWPQQSQTPVSQQPEVPISQGSNQGSLAGQFNTCGTHKFMGQKVAGGGPAKPAQFPWGVALFNNGRQFCGGSIISPTHILTAAHCVDQMTNEDAKAVTVRLGDHNLDTRGEEGLVEEDRRVKLIVKHKLFSMATLHHDVAIIIVDTPIQFRDNIRAVCLASGGDYADKLVRVSGWGLLSASGPRPVALQNIQFPVWKQADCQQIYSKGGSPAGITPGMLCAGSRGKDSCSGDSGGPMVHELTDNRMEQVGIVSWGIGCGAEDFPGVYTRVTEVRDWISKVMNTY